MAEQVRQKITQGEFLPGQRLSEQALSESLGISRNTLREVFRMLTKDGLVKHAPNRGVFVAVPSIASIIDIYRVRRLIECQALSQAYPRHPAKKKMREAVETAAALPDQRRLGRRGHRQHGLPHGDRRAGRQRTAQPVVRPGAGRTAPGLRLLARRRVPARAVCGHEREDPGACRGRRFFRCRRGAQRVPGSLGAHRAGGLCPAHERCGLGGETPAVAVVCSPALRHCASGRPRRWRYSARSRTIRARCGTDETSSERNIT